MVGVNLVNRRVGSSPDLPDASHSSAVWYCGRQTENRCPDSADGAICEIGGVWTSMPIGGMTKLATSAETGA
jgi:hypothetical protein